MMYRCTLLFHGCEYSIIFISQAGVWHVLSPTGSRTAFDNALTKYLNYRTVHVIDDRFPTETRCKPRRMIFQGTPPPSLLLRSVPAQLKASSGHHKGLSP